MSREYGVSLAERIDRRLQGGAFFLLCLMPFLLAVTRAGADIALCLIGLAFIAHCRLVRQWAWLRHPGFAALIVFWLWMLATAPLAGQPATAMISAAIWGRFIPFAAAVYYWLLASPSAYMRLFYSSALILGLLVVDTLWQYVTGVSLSGNPILGDRLGGPMNHANIGNLLLKTGLPALGIGAYAMTCARSVRLGAATLALMFGIVSVVMVSGERSVALLMLVAAGLTGILLMIRWPASRRWVLLTGMALVCLIGLLAATQSVVQIRSKALAEHVSDFWHSVYGQLFRDAVAVWQQYPLLGAGANQFRHVCAAAMPKAGTEYCDIHPHNLYFELLANTGAFGFGAFALAMVLLVLHALRRVRFRAQAALPAAFACATFLVLLFPLIVTQSFFTNWPGVLFWYSLSLALVLPKLAQKKEQPYER